MKTLGLLITTALVLPLGACMRQDRCDSNGWCGDTTPTQVCFYDHDCGSGYRCDGGTCVGRLPVPPPRGAGGYGGAADAGAGGQAVDAGSSGVGGAVADAGRSGTGGHLGGMGGATISGVGGSTTGAGGSVTGAGGSATGGSGAGGASQPPGDGGAPHGCDAGSGTTGCHPRPTPVCQFDHECGLTGRCVDGECQPACAADADCGTGQACVQGYCGTATTSGGQCVFNADCGTGATCINGYCHANCAADTDCAAKGQAKDRCVSGICQPDSGPHPQCRANTDCVGVHVTEDECVDAVCRTPCLSDTDCCVGSSGSICQMGYCVTSHEVAPQCHVSTDCSGVATCIDATCE